MSEQETRHGRHASARTRRDPRVVAWLVVGAFVLVVGLGFLVSRIAGGSEDGGTDEGDARALTTAESSSECAEPTAVSVVVDPSVSAVVTDLLDDLDCVEARVTGQQSDVTAAAAARPEGVGLGGTLPDVWVPSSSLWVAQARSTEAGAARIVTDPVSLASSPVVVAGAPGTAENLGWSDTAPQWGEIVRTGSVRVASSDPRTDAAALAALLAATDGSPTPEAVATLSGAVSVPSAQGRSPAQMVLEGEADVMPTSELDVIRAQQPSGQGTLTAGYDERLGSLDFPLVTFAGDDDSLDAAVATVTERLRGADAVEALQALGLRSADGMLAEQFQEGYGLDAGTRTGGEPATAEAVNAGLDAWAIAGRRARILLAIDRSGSMLVPLPDGTVAKSALARDSVVQLVNSASPDTDLGLWTFTTDGDEATIEPLVPLAPLSAQATGASQRQRLATAVTGIDPIAGGDTPLFQAVLEAYEAAQQNYAYGRLNAVVIVTDGINDHPSGTITEAEALDRLRLLYDGMRPVRILALGYGPETDLQGLARLADVTGGRAYQGLTEADAATLLARTLPEL
ncbi:MAG: substrate-binding domain-containing protein [Dermatophilaceae bacterium]